LQLQLQQPRGVRRRHVEAARRVRPQDPHGDRRPRPRAVIARSGREPVSYGSVARDQLPVLIEAFEALKAIKDPRIAAKLIGEHRLTHEMVPGELKQSPEVWAALVPHMPLTALVRSLGKLSQVGVIAPFSSATKHVLAQLGSIDKLRKARLHPLAMLTALRVYAQGHGERGKLSWVPVDKIVDALDQAFYACFENVEPTGKRTLLALDVSGSMGCGTIGGLPGVTPAVGSAAMAMVTLKAEAEVQTLAFSTTIREARISGKQRLDDVVKHLARIPMGGTDCAQPMLWALEKRVPIDVFQVYTDNETWYGQIHPHEALRRYREKLGIPAKLVVVGMTATKFSIADPDDAGMLDVVGFDSAAPAIMADFARG
ncbi:MAG: TROVE domain-containing protein, partial [Deltaproteobacteria bacterium]|nr:TROVE domain-containing protein [Deltaproteobacteria bacterium]